MKKLISHLLAGAAVLFFAGGAVAADTAPDVLVKSVVDDVLAIIKDNKDPQTLRTLAEQKVLPNFDFRQMTQMAAGTIWRQASESQKQSLENGFRSLLVNTYVAALSHTSSSAKTVEVKPVPASAAQGEALVRTIVKESGKPPVSIDYRLVSEAGAWKVVDVTIENISLVTNYRSSFSQEVAKSGIDGLIKTLEDKNHSPSRGGMG
jgi:phospholipid transport system substrate-binding protein